ncbi:salicylate 1-monooxygenase sala [Aspergillus cavernicola]|uniref:Salicylate 1-monooxygenase sala n=1 Tax=Aspergillus cavernicola TaxID=176166 RepID=A0ABR4HCL6_9EURO
MSSSTTAERPLDIAIVGAGIVGLALGIGLSHRNINVKVYEQAGDFSGFYGGIGFSPNAVRCMNLLQPQLVDAQRKTATPSGDPKNPMDWMVYIDAYDHSAASASGEEPELFRLYTGHRGFEGCIRAQFHEEMLKLLPDGALIMNKRMHRIEDGPTNDKVRLHFLDGSVAEADAVIGCDGIKSHTRTLILGDNHPACLPSYTQLYALRGLVPMERAIQALGEYKARNRHIHLGPDCYVITIPVGHGSTLNVVAFVSDTNDWPATAKLTAPASRPDAVQPFQGFGPPVRGIINAVAHGSPTLDKWAIFDSVDHPSPTYARGRVCIAGDAAHAMAPHHGSGAGCGIEDSLALATVLVHAMEKTEVRATVGKADALRAAFATYSAVRQPRAQWMAESSRFLGDMLVGRNSVTGRDWEKCSRELYTRSHRIWDFDEQKMLLQLAEEYERVVTGEKAAV